MNSTKALYRAGDILLPEHPCPVARDQQPQERHVFVWRPDAIEPTGIREDDLMVYGGSLCNE
jgi:hypothetical protein